MLVNAILGEHLEDFNEPFHSFRRRNVSNLFDDSLLDSALRHDFRHIDDLHH